MPLRHKISIYGFKCHDNGTCVVYLYKAAGGFSKKSAGGVSKIDSDAKVKRGGRR